MVTKRALSVPLKVVLVFVCLLLASSFRPGPAQAQALPGPTPGSTPAEALFRAGRAAMKARRYETACAQFRESNRIEPAIGTQLNMAYCEEALGHLAQALGLYQSVAAALPALDPRVELALKGAQELEKRVPRVILQAPSLAPADLSVVHNGTRFTSASFGVPIPVDLGHHVFVVQVPGRAERSFELQVRERELRTVFVEAGPVLPAQPASLDAERRRRRLQQQRNQHFTWGVLSLGVASSAFTIGGISGGLALRAKSIIDDPAHCDAKRACDAQGVAASERGEKFALVSNLAFAAGAVAAGAGVYLLVTRPAAPGSEPAANARLELRAISTGSETRVALTHAF